MWIRDEPAPDTGTPTYFQDMVREAIRELDHEYRAGEMDYFSYYQRRRILTRML